MEGASKRIKWSVESWLEGHSEQEAVARALQRERCFEACEVLGCFDEAQRRQLLRLRDEDELRLTETAAKSDALTTTTTTTTTTQSMQSFEQWLRDAVLVRHPDAHSVVQRVTEEQGVTTRDELLRLSDEQLRQMGFARGDVWRIRNTDYSDRGTVNTLHQTVTNNNFSAVRVDGGSVNVGTLHAPFHYHANAWSEQETMSHIEECRKLVASAPVIVPLFATREDVGRLRMLAGDLERARIQITEKSPAHLKDTVQAAVGSIDSCLSTFDTLQAEVSDACIASQVVDSLNTSYSDFMLEDFRGDEQMGNVDIGYGYIRMKVAKWEQETAEKAVTGDRDKVRLTMDKNSKDIKLEQLWKVDNEEKQASCRVVVHGEAGAGKTTLLKKIAFEWANGKLWSDKFKAVVFVKLRNVSKKIRKLEELVESITGCDFNTATAFVRWCSKHSDSVLWIMDGWDEVSIADNVVLQSIAANSERRVKYFLAGTRPQALQDVKRDMVLTIIGFNERGMREFVRRYFENGNEQLAAKVRNALKERWLRDACRSPLMLRFVCLVAKSLDEASRKTDIYRLVVDCMMERLASRVKGVNKKAARAKLRELAWNGFKNGRLLLSRDEVADEGLSLERSELLRSEGQLRGAGELESYSWTHFSLQEYMAAEYVCFEEVKRLGSELTELRRMMDDKSDVFFGFVCGLGGKALVCLEEWYPRDLKVTFSRFKVFFETGPFIWLVEERTGRALNFAVRVWLIEENWEKMLEKACIAGAEEFVKKLLSKRERKDYQRSVSSALDFAVRNCHVRIVQLLLDHGADVTAIASASVYEVARDGHTEVCLMLLDLSAATEWRVSALRGACSGGHRELVKCLLENGADPNLAGFLETPLVIASEAGEVEIVKLLLTHKADVNILCLNLSALMVACENGHHEIVELLVSAGANVNLRSALGRTALHLACEKGHLEVVAFLLQKGARLEETDHRGYTVLHFAAQSKSLATVEFLLKQGANVNSKTVYGRSPLMLAAGIDVVKLFVLHGAVVVDKDSDGWNALYHACKSGFVETVEFLISKGLSVSAKTKRGRLPLHIAAFYGRLKVVERLVSVGPYHTDVDADGWNALHFACYSGSVELVEYLLAKGFDINCRAKNGDSPLIIASTNGKLQVVQYLIQHGADASAIDVEGNSAVHASCWARSLQVAEVLLKAHPQLAKQISLTPMTYVKFFLLDTEVKARFSKFQMSDAGDWRACRDQDFEERDVQFIQQHPDVFFSVRGQLPLHVAALMGHYDLVELLLKTAPETVNMRTQNGHTALDIATKLRHNKVVRLLSRFQAETK